MSQSARPQTRVGCTRMGVAGTAEQLTFVEGDDIIDASSPVFVVSDAEEDMYAPRPAPRGQEVVGIVGRVNRVVGGTFSAARPSRAAYRTTRGARGRRPGAPHRPEPRTPALLELGHLLLEGFRVADRPSSPGGDSTSRSSAERNVVSAIPACPALCS